MPTIRRCMASDRTLRSERQSIADYSEAPMAGLAIGALTLSAKGAGRRLLFRRTRGDLVPSGIAEEI